MAQNMWLSDEQLQLIGRLLLAKKLKMAKTPGVDMQDFNKVQRLCEKFASAIEREARRRENPFL